LEIASEKVNGSEKPSEERCHKDLARRVDSYLHLFTGRALTRRDRNLKMQRLTVRTQLAAQSGPMVTPNEPS